MGGFVIRLVSMFSCTSLSKLNMYTKVGLVLLVGCVYCSVPFPDPSDGYYYVKFRGADPPGAVT